MLGLYFCLRSCFFSCIKDRAKGKGGGIVGGAGEGEKRAQELAQLLPILFAIDSKLQTSNLSFFPGLSRSYTLTHFYTREGRGEEKDRSQQTLWEIEPSERLFLAQSSFSSRHFPHLFLATQEKEEINGSIDLLGKRSLFPPSYSSPSFSSS